ncbi:hypothetical protein ACTU44_13120 [Thalassospira sp. SM2505]
MLPAMTGLSSLTGMGGGGSWLETSSEASAMSGARATSGQIYAYNTAPFIVGGEDESAMSVVQYAIPFALLGAVAWLMFKK